ncbi:sialidase family protein [Nocardiopsis alkaliphila]|uniref:sialidase family protein n=1 Tax=Nocardiopsis alkaliphila TaxID=225762 RepID=UPI0003472868|nr:sialidase family protein [Nocardiopsis alkaliphila]
MRKYAIPLIVSLGLSMAAPLPLPALAEDRPQTDTAPLFETTDLASAGEGAHTWRIPALEVLEDGTLIAAYDRRNDNASDLPGNLDLVVRRSHDKGRTWTEPQIVVDYDGGVGAGDPSLLVDRETGRIFLFHAHGPAGVGFFNSSDGNANDSDDILHADYSYSDDGGLTWNTRRITEDIKDPSWFGIFASSGTGIQTSQGRLIQQYAYDSGDGVYAVSVYSDDNGQTWQAGEPVGPGMDENKTVELADGRIMLNSRTAQGPYRLVAYSEDGGRTYSDPVPDHDLVDPTNNGAVVRYDPKAPMGWPEAHKLLFTNTNHASSRQNLTVRMSCDDGQSWPVSKVLDPGAAAYSTIVPLGSDEFGVLYERGNVEHITFARFNAGWLGGDCT